MINSELLAELILSDDKNRSELLANYKNICYFADDDGKALKLTVAGKKYKLVIDFPTSTDHCFTITLIATVDVMGTTDCLTRVSYRVHRSIDKTALVRVLTSLPNYAYLIPKDVAK